MHVDAEPYPWPYDGHIDPGRTALINIDWQTDFCGFGGYVDKMGYDLGLTRAGLEPTARVLAAARAVGMLVLHTREGHVPDLSDCPPNKLWRSKRIGAGIGDPGPARSLPGAGRAGMGDRARGGPRATARPIIDKPGKGAFYATDLDLVLRNRGITHLVFTGITTDVCVHTTMREGERPWLRVPPAERLHRRHRPRQLPGRAVHGEDAGWRVRGRGPVRRAPRRARTVTAADAPHLLTSTARAAFVDARRYLGRRGLAHAREPMPLAVAPRADPLRNSLRRPLRLLAPASTRDRPHTVRADPRGDDGPGPRAHHLASAGGGRPSPPSRSGTRR